MQIARAPDERAAPPIRRPSTTRRGLTPFVGFALALGMSAVSAGSASAQPEPGQETLVVRQRWDAHQVEVVLDDSLKELGPNVEQLVEAAFATWAETGAALPTIHFVTGRGAAATLEPDGKSTVLLAPIEFEGHESDLAITIGFSNPQDGEVSEADIVINSAHQFSTVSGREVELSGNLAKSSNEPDLQESCAGTLDARGCKSAYDLQNVLTHEVGHFFGLGENYDDTRATMFSCTSACETHKRDLAHIDSESIVELYAARTEGVDAGCSGVQIGGRASRTNLGFATGWVLLSLLWLHRRLQTGSQRARRVIPLPARNRWFGQ